MKYIRNILAGYMVLMITLGGLTAVLRAQGEQWLNLPEEPQSPRFPLTDRVWPTTYGDAVVCLWPEDKMAAACVTIDDNVRAEHDWWLAQMDRLGWKMTWFVITDQIYKNPTYYGTWDDFRRLFARGHSIQSHTVHHFPDGDVRTDEEMTHEYGFSIQELETNIPGNRCLTVAYPYGKGKLGIAAQHFISARGVGGLPSPANRISYLRLSIANHSRETANLLIQKTGGSADYWRGMIAPLYHDVFTDKAASEKEIKELEAIWRLDHWKSLEPDLWVDTYVNEVKYGQERDTLHLTVTKREPQDIRFELSDSMKDTIFDYPLTIKVCLGSAWMGGVSATQNNQNVSARRIEKNGMVYALVQAVPDRGTVTVTPSPAWLQVLTPNGGEHWLHTSTHAITWHSVGVSGNATIELHRRSGLIQTLGTVPITSGSFDWTVPADLVRASDYTIRVNGGSESDVSDAPFTILPTGLDTIPPSAPSNLRVAGLTTTSVTLAWDAASDNHRVAGYYIYQVSNTHVDTVSASRLSYRCEWLSPGNTYRFQIFAVDAEGNRGPGSTILTVTTPKNSQTLNLVPGWNWISLNVLPTDCSLNAVFNGIQGQVTQVKTQTRSAIRMGGSWRGDLADITSVGTGSMVKVNVTAACSLAINGTAISPSLSISLAPGWNWIAYTRQTALPIDQALRTIRGQVLEVRSRTQSAVFDGINWSGTLTQMEPGQGYVVWVNASANLVYPL